MDGRHTGLENLQKLSDIYDVFDPAMDQVLREELRAKPFAVRRQWEFSIIYLALQRAGHLNARARGLAMGAGTERLIYVIAPKVEKAIITDLYGMDGGWKGLNTPDPQELIINNAPWQVDPSRIEAVPMDMRSLQFPDESFDFCWSTGAIEHIGGDEDFVQHFNEVWRVLKPGGMYALTTACILGRQTARIPHNYYFEPQHLLDLAHESKLQANPVFDCHLREHSLNDAKFEEPSDFGFPAGNSTSPLVAWRRGNLIVGNSLIFTKAEGPKVRPTTVGLEETTERARRTANMLTERTWREWQLLNLAPQANALRCQPQWFGDHKVAMQVLGRFQRVRIFSRPLISSSPTLFMESNEPNITFRSDSESLYIVRVLGGDEDGTVLRARFCPELN